MSVIQWNLAFMEWTDNENEKLKLYVEGNDAVMHSPPLFRSLSAVCIFRRFYGID